MTELPKIPKNWTDAEFVKGKIACPLCASDDWRTGALIVTEIADENAGAILPGKRAVMAQVVCGSCRYVLLFNVGILDFSE